LSGFAAKKTHNAAVVGKPRVRGRYKTTSSRSKDYQLVLLQP
jgi:hypothetical protein